MICSEKIPVAKENTITKIWISRKYKSLFNPNTWRNDVLPKLNNSSQIVDSHIRETYYMDIQNDNILDKGTYRYFGYIDTLKYHDIS